MKDPASRLSPGKPWLALLLVAAAAVLHGTPALARAPFPFMWIANAGEDTVSKFDTQNNLEVARYRTWFGPDGQAGHQPHPGAAWSGAAPSRTSVDPQTGDVYVLNRHFDGRPALLMKILRTGGVDRNGNGTIDTSSDLNGDGLIDNAEMKPLADRNANGRIDADEIQDERIAWAVTVGGDNGLGRALCMGTDRNLWVGLYNAQEYWKVSGADGSMLAGPVAVTWTPYGCLVDAENTLWSASINWVLGKIANTQGSGPYGVEQFSLPAQDYGIAVGNRSVYLAALSGQSYIQFDPATQTASLPAQEPRFAATGIAVDGNGNILTGAYYTGGINKYAPDGTLIWTSPSQFEAESRGVILDQDDNAWQVSLGGSRVMKYRGTDGAPLGVFPVGDSPYTYSDAAGSSASEIIFYTVTAQAGAHGRIDPPSQVVNVNTIATFTVTPDAGYVIDTVTGCGGSLTGDTYSTAPVTAHCQVTATFKTPDTPTGRTVEIPDVSGQAGSQRFFKILIPAGATNLNVRTGGGTGNPDLYVKAGSKPQTTSADCASVNPGTEERCTFAAPQTGIYYYILLVGTAAYSDVTLTISWDVEVPPVTGCGSGFGGKNGGAWGDPHLTAFDGLAYDFQGVGEFIFVKSRVPGDPFEVQARTRPWGDRTDVSVAQAIAMKIGGDRVTFYDGRDPGLRINGVPTTVADGTTLALPAGGGSVTRSGQSYCVAGADGSAVGFSDQGNYLDVSVRIPASKYSQVHGLLGNADGNTQNDIALRDGTILGTQIDFATLYPRYADSWRIAQTESLFDYEPGETTDTFTDRNFPRVPATTSGLTDAVRGPAEQICRAAGVTNPTQLDNCILDVVLTGDPTFANTPPAGTTPTATVEVTPPPPPTIDDPGFGQIIGTVVDAVTSLGLDTGKVDVSVNGTPLSGVTSSAIDNGLYETKVVPIGSGYRLDLSAPGYIPETVFDLTVQDRQKLQLAPVSLVPLTAAGNGVVAGHVRNALNNASVPNLNVFARRYINQRMGDPAARAVTDANGDFTLNGLAPGNYTLELQGTGYITNYVNAVSIGGQTTTTEGVVTPELTDTQFRIVLTWGETPWDLDSYLSGPDEQGGRFLIAYYSAGDPDLTVAPYAYLDRDDTSSYGPETITIGRLLTGDVYRYSVHDYSNGGSTSSDALGQSGAKIEVYGENQLLATFNVPNLPGTLWTVFEIDQTGHIIPVNRMTYESASSATSAPSPAAINQEPTSGQTDYWPVLFQAIKKR